jgi:hypothetical protein
VAETPEEVAAAVHAHRAAVLSDALRRRSGAPRPASPGRRDPTRLSAVEDAPT